MPIDGPPHRRFPAGQVLVRQGDPGNSAWLIQSGSLEVLLTPPTGAHKRLGVLGPGAVFGEMALLDDGPRSATVRTLTEVECVELSRSVFDQMERNCPPLAAFLLRALIGQIRVAYGLPPSPPLTGTEETAIRSTRSAQRLVERRSFPVDAVFHRQGDQPRVAYLIQHGLVSIRQNDVERARLGPGAMFGEVSVLNNRPCGETAVAIDPVVCEIIRKTDLDEAIAAMPPILRALSRIYLDQLTAKR